VLGLIILGLVFLMVCYAGAKLADAYFDHWKKQ